MDGQRVVILSLFVFGILILAGCAQQGPQTGGNGTQPPANATPPATQPQANATTPPPTPTEPQFTPIHLSYLYVMPGPDNQPGQEMNLDYYLVEKTQCLGRPALNGFMQTTQKAHPDQKSYIKITVYLDSGEAVYSTGTGESELAFDKATPRTLDFDPAFMPQSVLARGGKNMLSDEVLKGTKPTLVKDVAAVASIGDYSISKTGESQVAGLSCTNFTLAASTENFMGQILVCAHILDDVNLSFVASGVYVGPNVNWKLTAMSRETPSAAFYPQCLEPVACPVVARPKSGERDACQAQNKTFETERNEQNCISAFGCVSYEEKARKEFARNQRTGCAINEDNVKIAANCWTQNGNINYNYEDRTGCIKSIACNMPPRNQ